MDGVGSGVVGVVSLGWLQNAGSKNCDRRDHVERKKKKEKLFDPDEHGDRTFITCDYIR